MVGWVVWDACVRNGISWNGLDWLLWMWWDGVCRDGMGYNGWGKMGWDMEGLLWMGCVGMEGYGVCKDDMGWDGCV